MTELVHHQTATGLALRPDQVTFDDDQRKVLAHMGVEDAPEADLRVFMHVAQRSGLDPFARQIHMIGRNSKDQRTNSWVTKYTIQTGIDGYRLIGRRAADRIKATISIGQPEWAHEDGTWRQVWTRTWGTPVAARVTILRDGHPFTAVAIFDEYKQTKRDGGLTSMWAQRPAGQLAKCAEALAWRMAFPQDLSGIYVDEEMQQADSEHGVQHSAPPAPVPTAADFKAPEQPSDDVEDAEVVEEVTGLVELISDGQRRAMFAAFTDAGFTTDARSAEGRAARLEYISRIVGRPVESSSDLTTGEASQVLDALNADAEEGQA